jgi:[NiFe] hydrogenase large subunit
LGPVEEALIGTPVSDAKQPLEILRTVHSFDPCVACGVHVIDPDSNEVYKFKAL